MSVYKGSRYTRTGLYQSDSSGALILAIRQKTPFNMDSCTYYTVVEGDTIDGIAHRQYGNAQLYWAIMDANPSYLSELEIQPGDVIAIPAYDEVVKFIG